MQPTMQKPHTGKYKAECTLWNIAHKGQQNPTEHPAPPAPEGTEEGYFETVWLPFV